MHLNAAIISREHCDRERLDIHAAAPCSDNLLGSIAELRHIWQNMPHYCIPALYAQIQRKPINPHINTEKGSVCTYACAISMIGLAHMGDMGAIVELQRSIVCTAYTDTKANCGIPYF